MTGTPYSVRSTVTVWPSGATSVTGACAAARPGASNNRATNAERRGMEGSGERKALP